jgi:CRISPR type III-B/RAMP module-associated protein Cmr3
MKYLIKPLDVLSFRDGRPFGSLDDHRIRLSFPPSLSTLYGALRASILAHQKDAFYNIDKLHDQIKEFAGTKEKFGNLCIEDFGYYKKSSGRLFVTPNDILKVKTKDEFVIAKPSRLPAGCKVNFPGEITELSIPVDTGNNFFENPPAFITEAGLKKYLNNQNLVNSDFVDADDFYKRENRTGIKIDKNTRSVTEGALFSIEFARLHYDSDFYMETNYSFEPIQIKFGGEGRAASLKSLEDDSNGFINELTFNNGIKVLLITPLFSENGWQPEQESIQILADLLNQKLTLITVSAGGYTGIGGWDIQQNRSKPLRRFLTTGSVLYFKTESKGTIKNNKIINISRTLDDIKQGFGLSIIGGI